MNLLKKPESWGLGIAGYLGHLSYSVFKDSNLFPFALSFIGLVVVWQKREAAITERLRSWLPATLRQMIENIH